MLFRSDFTYPQKYIYIQPSYDEQNGLEYEIKCHAGIGDLLNSIAIIWEAVKAEAEDLSDQDIYELCDDFDLDYNVFKEQLRRDSNE